MENKNGQGVFLGVVAVATLVVAIIGATFAYFSATVNSAEGDVNLTAYDFDVEIYSIEKVAPELETGIIPLFTNHLSNALAGYEDYGRCIDKNHKQVCVIYKATLQNHSTTTGGVNFTSTVLKTTTNGFIYVTTPEVGEPETVTDLKVVYLGTGNDVPTISETPTVLAVPALPDGTVTLDSTTINIPPAVDDENPGEAYLYFVMYLSDDDTNQSEYMSQSYTGQLILSGTDGSRITGTFN